MRRVKSPSVHEKIHDKLLNLLEALCIVTPTPICRVQFGCCGPLSVDGWFRLLVHHPPTCHPCPPFHWSEPSNSLWLDSVVVLGDDDDDHHRNRHKFGIMTANETPIEGCTESFILFNPKFMVQSCNTFLCFILQAISLCGVWGMVLVDFGFFDGLNVSDTLTVGWFNVNAERLSNTATHCDRTLISIDCCDRRLVITVGIWICCWWDRVMGNW